MGYFIYCLRCPIDKRVVYVGQTVSPDKREAQHSSLRSFQTIGKFSWLKELKEVGLSPIFEILEECEFDQMGERELHWIKHFVEKGCRLFNRPVGRIREQDFVTKVDWGQIHAYLTEMRNDLLNIGTFLKNTVSQNCRESRETDKAVKSIDELRFMLEERFKN
jgi:hypothetical protein